MRKGVRSCVENTCLLPRNTCKKQTGCLGALKISEIRKSDIASISGATSTSFQNIMAAPREVPRTPTLHIEGTKTFQGLVAPGERWVAIDGGQRQAAGQAQPCCRRSHPLAGSSRLGRHSLGCTQMAPHPSSVLLNPFISPARASLKCKLLVKPQVGSGANAQIIFQKHFSPALAMQYREITVIKSHPSQKGKGGEAGGGSRGLAARPAAGQPFRMGLCSIPQLQVQGDAPPGSQLERGFPARLLRHEDAKLWTKSQG